MSIITDVGRDLAELRGKTDAVALRKFGLLVGGVFAVLGAWLYWGRDHAAVGATFMGIGAVLVVFGVLAPLLLRGVYYVWMGLAMSLGWVVSRVLLVVLFMGMVLPLGLIARLVGKRFVDLPKRGERETMWVPRSTKPANYEKMY